jgi:hypothetical protein
MFNKSIKSLAFVGTAAAITREPLLTWKAAVPVTHPQNYYVPNFGVDENIRVNNQNLKDSEKQVGH